MSVKTESDVINSEDKVHNTPLQLAAKEGHVTAVETLLQHNASMSSKDVKMEFNALDWAIENGHRYAVCLSFYIKNLVQNMSLICRDHMFGSLIIMPFKISIAM